MALTPFRGFRDMQDQMKRTFDDVFGGLQPKRIQIEGGKTSGG